MDLNKRSVSIEHTPSLSSKRLPFYLHGYGHFYADSSYFTEREGLDNYLLIYTISGSGSLKYNGEEYKIEQNQTIIFHCLEYQYYSTIKDGGIPWEFKWIHMNGTGIKEYYDMINSDNLCVVTMGKDSITNQMMEAIEQALIQKDMLMDIKICSSLMSVLTEMVTCRHSSLNSSSYHQHKSEIEKAISFIKDNYDKKISNDDIAMQVYISKYHFLRLFKAYTGTSPYEYLINYRINVSKALLRETSYSIAEIALVIGFGDVNNYIRYFKRLTGTTPAKHRRIWVN